MNTIKLCLVGVVLTLTVGRDVASGVIGWINPNNPQEHSRLCYLPLGTVNQSDYDAYDRANNNLRNWKEGL